MSVAVHVGLEVLLAEPPIWLRNQRLGLLQNQASVDREFRYSHERIAERWPGQLRAIFSPQHGLFSTQQDNMIETPHSIDAELGLPVHSLYSQTRQPTPAMLADIDLLLVDLQDVGCRVYTYLWTLLLCLQACAKAGKAIAVLDRPNPVGGGQYEGPRLDLAYQSFVGLAAIPMRHGLTLAEAARWLNRDIGAELHIVAMQGWQRVMDWPDTRRPWLPPSPNLPRFESAMVYPGQVLLEGTNLSEGRGTTTPFEICGAPYVDGHRLAKALTDLALPGVVFRPVQFEPTFQKWQGQTCGGVFVHVVDPWRFRPYRTTLALLGRVRELWPKQFAWRSPPYEYEAEKLPIDILAGGPELRLRVDDGTALSRLAALADCDDEWSAEVGDVAIYS